MPELLGDTKRTGYLENRLEYSVEMLKDAYELSDAQAQELYKLIQAHRA